MCLRYANRTVLLEFLDTSVESFSSLDSGKRVSNIWIICLEVGNSSSKDGKVIEFGHYKTYPYEFLNPRLIVNFRNNSIEGYIEKEMDSADKELIYSLLEKYHVYLWIFDEYHIKSNTRNPDDLEGYDWYLEIVFEDNIIWHIFGYNDYPDTYVHLAHEVRDISGMDLLEIDTISDKDLELFEKFGKMKLTN